MNQSLKNTFRSFLFTTRLILKNTPFFSFCYGLIKITIALIPTGLIWVAKLIMDELIFIYNGGNTNVIWKYILIEFSLVMIQSIFTEMTWTLLKLIRDKNESFLSSAISEKLSKIEIRRLEDEESRTVIYRVMQSQYSITGSYDTFVSNILIPFITFISTVSVIFYYYPVVAVLYICTVIPTMILNQTQSEKMNKHSIDSIPEARKKDYYYEILTEGQYAKELRLYNIASIMRQRYNALWKKLAGEREKIFIKGFKNLSFASILSCGGYIGLYSFLIYKTSVGEITVSELAAFSSAVLIISNSFSGIVSSFLNFKMVYVDLILAVRTFFNWKNEGEGEDNGEATIAMDNQQLEIEFRDVSFTYPNTDNVVLDHLSFTIRSGEKVALVGVNGAGKSTIVKLLLRLYEPSSGVIRINGIDYRNIDINAYRKCFAVCFQNIAHYALSLQENIALSNIENSIDMDKIVEVARQSGLAELYEGWDEKLQTSMSRDFDSNGVNLSGGQWQKVGIARTFFRNAPFVILDEPSAALDPFAERQVFSSFAKLCGDKSGILISHRLSSIMLVDRILFLKNGKISEEGTHEELMSLQGEYAEMYSLQSQQYKDA